MAGFDFSQIPSVSIPRSRFPIAKNILTTANPDVVIPIYWCEVLHSDTFDMKKKNFKKHFFFLTIKKSVSKVAYNGKRSFGAN